MAMENAIESLARLIKYPGTLPDGASEYTFMVDKRDMKARLLSDGRLMFSHTLCYLAEVDIDRLTLLGQLAGMAFGRSLRDEGILSYDPSQESIFLWQATSAEGSELIYQFEAFIASCEWWEKRVQGILEPQPVFPSIMIRP